MDNDRRIQLEESIVRMYLAAVEAKGWLVHSLSADGEDLDGIDDLFACDEAHVLLAHKDDETRHAWLYFVYGNEPDEVLNDYTGNLAPIIEDVDARYSVSAQMPTDAPEAVLAAWEPS